MSLSLIHISLHLDEGTPHIHERHVFDCENRYGELCPQQEKALEELGIPLPNPEKPKGRNNNRKQTFDAVCQMCIRDSALPPQSREFPSWKSCSAKSMRTTF